MTVAALIAQTLPGRLEEVYPPDRRQRLAELADFLPEAFTPENLPARRDEARRVEVLFSTWGMPTLAADAIAEFLPALKAVFYAAGTVKAFAEPFLERGVAVVSAWAANALPVAEVALSQILLSGKSYFRCVGWHRTPPDARAPGGRPRGPGNYRGTVAILGAGMIGRRVLELLRPFDLERLVYDPYLADEDAARLGARRVSLEEAFARARVVSNHVPNLPELAGMIRREHFASMPEGATFINTGRGRQVDEAGMIEVLRARPDLTALLDVTFPEPPAADSPLWSLPNVWLSGHMAGAEGNEVLRMTDLMLEEFTAWKSGRPLRYAVDAGMLERMA